MGKVGLVDERKMAITTIKDHIGLLHEEMPDFEESKSVPVASGKHEVDNDSFDDS